MIMHTATHPGGLRPSAWLILGVLSVALSGAWAQDNPRAAPQRDTPRPDQLEPGVETSPTAAPTAAPSPPLAPPASHSTSAGADSGAASQAPKAPKAASSRSKPGAPAEANAQATTDGQPPKSGARAGKGHDRIELDPTQITGNRELPKVLYIVPWKRSDLGDLTGRPVNSLLDEMLQPVDRDVFRRENRYYEALKPDAAEAAPKAQGSSEPR